MDKAQTKVQMHSIAAALSSPAGFMRIQSPTGARAGLWTASETYITSVLSRIPIENRVQQQSEDLVASVNPATEVITATDPATGTVHARPALQYHQLVNAAIASSPGCDMTSGQLFARITREHPYFLFAEREKLRMSIRHNGAARRIE
ncbi:hypothetical protein H9P43_005144 [Blastocladiella emersonii ATCC 22665]|nr:hypothetical protein H9P43_005144 [Blastocladiella emersonii ATCC 22665]